MTMKLRQSQAQTLNERVIVATHFDLMKSVIVIEELANRMLLQQ